MPASSKDPESTHRYPKEKPVIKQIRQKWASGLYPYSFAGMTQVKRYYPKQTMDTIRKALDGVDSYTMERPAKRPRFYNPIFVFKKREQFQADLIVFDPAKYSKPNEGFVYLLVVIDSFTRYVWIKMLKKRDSATVLKAFTDLYSDELNGEFAKELLTDNGGEFENNKMRKWLEKIGSKLVISNSKAATVERFNRTFQKMVHTYMATTTSLEYFRAIPGFVRIYNERYHRTIKMSPARAELERNHQTVLENVKAYYDKATGYKKHLPRLKVGELVRISNYKKTFSKGYRKNFKAQIYRIKSINTKMPVPMYTITNESTGEQEAGQWYEAELQRAIPNYTPGLVYKSSDTGETRTRNGILERRMLYDYWPDQYGQWEPAENVNSLEEERDALTARVNLSNNRNLKRRKRRKK